MLTAVAELIAGSFPSRAPRAVPARGTRDVARARSRWQARSDVIGEVLFRDVLVRERRRAERFEQPFFVLAVTATGGTAPAWDAAIDAVTVARRDTDILGWLETGTVLALILPETDAHDLASSEGMVERVRQELAARTAGQDSASLEVTLHAFAPAPETSGAVDAAEPLAELVAPRPRTPVRDALKRTLDVLGSAALLVLLSPLFVAIAALVKLTSPGPVFFRQQRIGEAARPFTMLKFRSMRVDADPAIHQAYVSQFIKAGAAAAAGDAPFKIANDPRVTRVGSILRKTSLDELPQLWNVLRGEMSLVGPRPPLPYEVEQYKPWHRRRVLEARPGITGLWQVKGRSRTTFDDMVRLDLRYARTYSAWTDIKILLATPKAVISGKGAC